MKGKKYLVLGAGRSGIAATKLLLQHGASVELYDDQAHGALKYFAQSGLAGHQGLKVSFGHNPSLSEAHCVILSPGVPLDHELLKQAQALNIEVLSEIDCAYALMPPTKMIGISGTNGKSTTTVMVENILKCAGLRVYAGGNLGVPLSELALKALSTPLDYLVVELSSFQLESIKLAQLDIAILLNITPDHLDRYGTMSDYQNAKLRILDLVKPNGHAVVNHDLQNLVGLRAFSISWFQTTGAEVEQLRLAGTHNQENARAAMLATLSLGIAEQTILAGLQSYDPLPHRCELVGVKEGVTYINDSKGTTVVAVTKALSMTSGPVHLLLGGIAKGEDFFALGPENYPQIAGYYVYGEAQSQILSALNTPLAQAHQNLSEAFDAARRKARPGHTVLLSPGCASYDQFTDFTERGRLFKSLVEKY